MIEIGRARGQDEDGKPLGTRESFHVLLRRSATG
jgi:hypothetical protein